MLTLKNDDYWAIGLPVAGQWHGRHSALAPDAPVYHKSKWGFNLRLKFVLLSQVTTQLIIHRIERNSPLALR